MQTGVPGHNRNLQLTYLGERSVPAVSQRIIKWASLAVAALTLVLCIGAVISYAILAPGLPDVATLRDIQMQVPLRVYSRDGRLMAQIGEQRRTPVRFAEVPPPLVHAFLAAEDDRFFSHSGIDAPSLLRAFIVTAAAGEARQGGSTITMQLARNMFLGPEKHLARKLREILLALRIEHQFSKEEILTLYLNKIFLGERAYGVAAAADVYYGKTLSELTLAEMATIASLPKAPSSLNPIANPERARQRRSYVLRRMLDIGYITQREYDTANTASIETTEHGPRVEVAAPFIAEMVRAQLAPKFGESLYTAGIQVITTIDSRLQRSADWSLRAALLEYDRRHGWRGASGHSAKLPANPHAATQMLEHFNEIGGLIPAIVVKQTDKTVTAFAKDGRSYDIPWETGLSWAHAADRPGTSPHSTADIVVTGDVVYLQPSTGSAALLAQVPLVQGSFVSLDPQDGAITALAGGFDFYTSKFNRTVQAKRQPGSSFKPFIYSAALEQGFTPATIILDAPLVLGSGSDEMWRPENDSKIFYGPTRLRDALARSRNLVSIRILRSIGVDYAIDYASRFGFNGDSLPHNLTLALGTAQISPLELTTGFAVFANGGFRVEPYLIDRLLDANGHLLEAADPRVACQECATPIESPRVSSGDAPTQSVSADTSSDAIRLTGDHLSGSVFSATPNTAGITRKSDLGINTMTVPHRLAPRVISAANAYIMTDLMRDVIRRGTGRRAMSLKRDDIAGKTGTTNDHRDTWFTGFNADIVAGAWVGFDQERSLGAGEEGGHTALPMWVYFMGEALSHRPAHRLSQPEDVISARVSPTSGALSGPNDPDAVFELFLAGHLPDSGGLSHKGLPTGGNQRSTTGEEPIF